MDGHRALKNEKVNEQSVQSFQLVLSALDDDPRSLKFIIHATSHTLGLFSSLHPLSFLLRIGYQQFKGTCPFHHERCLWIHLATVQREPFADHWQVDLIHQAFKSHAQALPEVYNFFERAVSKLQLPNSVNLDLFPELRQFVPPVLKPGADAMPEWVIAELPTRFTEVEVEIHRLKEEATRLRSMAALLWETGGTLEEAVCETFRALDYKSDQTTKSKTYDITVNLGGNKRLLVEVTGIEGALKKDSNKIAQALQALQQEVREGDRVVLGCNVYRLRPVKERAALEAVTPDALTLITKLGVNVVTTLTLFEVWKLSLTNREAARGRINDLHAWSGGLFTNLT